MLRASQYDILCLQMIRSQIADGEPNMRPLVSITFLLAVLQSNEAMAETCPANIEEPRGGELFYCTGVDNRCFSRKYQKAEGVKSFTGSFAHFVFVSRQGMHANGLLSVKITKKEKSNLNRVRLRRDKIDFGCDEKGDERDLKEINETSKQFKSYAKNGILYDKYDQFHRFGHTAPFDADYQFLETQYHFRYKLTRSDVACSGSTLNAGNQYKFLFTDPTKPSLVRSIAWRFGYKGSTALAATGKSHIVKILKYRLPEKAYTCVRFKVRLAAETEVSIDDLTPKEFLQDRAQSRVTVKLFRKKRR